MGSTDTPFATSTGLFDRDISIRSSIRKVLPALPPADEIPLISQKSSACPGASYSYSQFLREYLLIAEYRKLQEVKIPGVYVIPSQQSSLQWFGVIFIRLGPYKDGVFRYAMITDGRLPGLWSILS
ncbi:unnamed protein product [Cyprideis torosa]|uniref:Uncharacterized protein n=1 Tax=Cyprideis torosa TaxID=163714 RepID=A0A7R8WAM4_9CRUS|nr:unnamed protein product [Cyprideis torosa]CAG0891206.1 unnamed protein product [Cyprideis torosa]